MARENKEKKKLTFWQGIKRALFICSIIVAAAAVASVVALIPGLGAAAAIGINTVTMAATALGLAGLGGTALTAGGAGIAQAAKNVVNNIRGNQKTKENTQTKNKQKENTQTKNKQKDNTKTNENENILPPPALPDNNIFENANTTNPVNKSKEEIKQKYEKRELPKKVEDLADLSNEELSEYKEVLNQEFFDTYNESKASPDNEKLKENSNVLAAAVGVVEECINIRTNSVPQQETKNNPQTNTEVEENIFENVNPIEHVNQNKEEMKQKYAERKLPKNSWGVEDLSNDELLEYKEVLEEEWKKVSKDFDKLPLNKQGKLWPIKEAINVIEECIISRTKMAEREQRKEEERRRTYEEIQKNAQKNNGGAR